MALKRVTATLTVAAGVAADDVRLSIPSSPARPCYLEAIAVDDTAATGQLLSLTVAEGYDIAGDGVIESGQELFSVDDAGGNLLTGSLDTAGATTGGSLPLIVVRSSVGVVDEKGESLTTSYQRVPIRSQYLVVTGYTGPKRLVSASEEGDVYTVYVYYETAGDWRW